MHKLRDNLELLETYINFFISILEDWNLDLYNLIDEMKDKNNPLQDMISATLEIWFVENWERPDMLNELEKWCM